MEAEHISDGSYSFKVISIGRAVPLQAMVCVARIDHIVGFGESGMCISIAGHKRADRRNGQRVPPALLQRSPGLN